MSNFQPDTFQISKEDAARLDDLYATLSERSEKFLGYPCNLLYDYKELWRFFAFSINNVGDPFVDSLYGVNTRTFEREVLHFFMELYHAPKNDSWGYVTNGGTEGNMYGLYLARESFPNGIVYFSQDTHYSISKIVKVLGMRNVMIRSQKNGEIDYEDLEEMIKVKRDHTPIIVANIGTTVKGAIDRVEKIEAILKQNVVDYYIHCDAALGGMIVPFLFGSPSFDFRTSISSLAVSGHKMIGSPTPSGVVLARKKNVERVQRNVEYIGTLDTTLSGSRNGHSVLFLWYAIHRFGVSGFQKMVYECMSVTEYAVKRLQEIGWEVQVAEYYNTVVIKRPPEALVKKFQLAVEGDIAHILVMPHVTKERINGLIADLEAVITAK